MESYDGMSTPRSTLLLRLAIGDETWDVAARCWSEPDVEQLRELVTSRSLAGDARTVALLWLGDVASGAAPVAAALLDVEPAVGTATVLAMHPLEPGEQLLGRLGVGLIEVASSYGCTTLSVHGSTVDPDPARLLRASGRAPLPDTDPPVWSLER
ncbi:MAG: hypothetical protein ACYC2O_05905 [Microthrixaceae bacterium]